MPLIKLVIRTQEKRIVQSMPKEIYVYRFGDYSVNCILKINRLDKTVPRVGDQLDKKMKNKIVLKILDISTMICLIYVDPIFKQFTNYFDVNHRVPFHQSITQKGPEVLFISSNERSGNSRSLVLHQFLAYQSKISHNNSHKVSLE